MVYELAKKLKDVYPDFGLLDIKASSLYLTTVYQEQKDVFLVGTQEYRTADYIARYWGVVHDISHIAIQTENQEAG